MGAVAGAPAQQPANTSGWAPVQALKVGTGIDLKTDSQHLACHLTATTENSLTCTFGEDNKPQNFQRADIRWVKVHHRGRSALAGAAIGAGVGVIAGAASGGCVAGKDCLVSRDAAALVAAVALAVIGAPIGAITDFTHSTIYRRP